MSTQNICTSTWFVTYVERHPTPSLWPGGADYIVASHCARSMHMLGPILISPNVHLPTHDCVFEEGFSSTSTLQINFGSYIWILQHKAC